MCGIQASRISSQLHVYHRKGELEFGVFPRRTLFDTLNPIPTFFSEGLFIDTVLHTVQYVYYILLLLMEC